MQGPTLVTANTPRVRRWLVGHADGPVQVAESWRQLWDLAAERGRIRPLRTVVRVNLDYAAKRYEGQDRQPFQGAVHQLVTDLMAYAEIGLDEFWSTSWPSATRTN